MLIAGNHWTEINKIVPAKHIVSLVPSLTETVASLGAKDTLAGVTQFCKYPESICREAAVVGGPKNFDVEKIIRLHPDVVIAVKEENDKTGILKLAEVLPVILFDILNMEDAFGMILTLGRLLRNDDKARLLVQEIREKFAAVKALIPPKKCLYLIWKNPWMAAGRNTFINEMLSFCGFENVAEGRYPEVADEHFLATDIILLSSEPYSFRQKHLELLKIKYPQKQIILVDGEMFSWYGSHMVQAGRYFRELLQQI